MDINERSYYDHNSAPMSVKDWLISLLLLLIPLVNIILPFVWAFGGNVNINKKNFFRAYLIYMAIGLVLGILTFSVFGAALFSNLGSQPY
jgi:hypothetical protein